MIKINCQTGGLAERTRNHHNWLRLRIYSIYIYIFTQICTQVLRTTEMLKISLDISYEDYTYIDLSHEDLM